MAVMTTATTAAIMGVIMMAITTTPEIVPAAEPDGHAIGPNSPGEARLEELEHETRRQKSSSRATKAKSRR